MRMATLSEVTAKFRNYLKASEEGPIVVTKKGKPVAVLLSVTDEEEVERLLLSHSPQFQAILQAGKKQIKERRSMRHEEFWRRVEAKEPDETATRKRV